MGKPFISAHQSYDIMLLQVGPQVTQVLLDALLCYIKDETINTVQLGIALELRREIRYSLVKEEGPS